MGDPTTATHPEAALARAVILQAFEDARTPPSPKGSAHRPRAAEHIEARCFLLDVEGPWAKVREIWAQHAGIDAEALRHRAAQTLPAAPLALRQPLPSGTHRTPPGHTKRDQVLAMIRAAALAGQPCPTNPWLAKRLGRTGANNVANLLRELCVAGRLCIEREGRRRIAADPAGAWRTATRGGSSVQLDG